MAVVVSLNLRRAVELYKQLYLNPCSTRAETWRRRLLWTLPRLSPKEQDRYYALILAWKVEREMVQPNPGLEWPTL